MINLLILFILISSFSVNAMEKNYVTFYESNRFELSVWSNMCIAHNKLFYITDAQGTTNRLDMNNYETEQVYKNEGDSKPSVYNLKINNKTLFFKYYQQIVGRDSTTLQPSGNYYFGRDWEFKAPGINDFACNEKQLVYSSGCRIKLWDLQHKKCSHSLEIENNPYRIAITNDGTNLITGSSPSNMYSNTQVVVDIWDTRHLIKPTMSHYVPSRINAFLILQNSVFVALHDGSLTKHALHCNLSTVICNPFNNVQDKYGGLILNAHDTGKTLKKWRNNIISFNDNLLSLYDIESGKPTGTIKLPYHHKYSQSKDSYYSGESDYPRCMDVDDDKIVVASNSSISIYQES